MMTKIKGITVTIDGKDMGDSTVPKELTIKEDISEQALLIQKMEKETKEIRKALVKNELDFGIRKGLYDELVEAGLADEQIYKFAAVLAGWHV